MKAAVRLPPSTLIQPRKNRVGSGEFAEDLLLLQQFRDRIDSVFIPKVECSGDIAAFYAATACPYRLCPIVETRRGVRHVLEIVSSAFAAHMDFVFFGNYDYHLDADIYPIREQDSRQYWDTITPLIAAVESRRLRFGNSPYACITDRATLDFSVSRLTRICRSDFALMSLHRTQTQHFSRLLQEQPSGPAGSIRVQRHDTVVTAFAQYRQKGRSFSFDNNRIITPQEYQLALRTQHG